MVKDYPEKDKSLLYNTLTQALVVLDKDSKNRFDNIESNGQDKEMLKNMERMGFIIEDRADEIKIFKYWIEQLKYYSYALNFCVLMTYDCNFGCPYCIEEGVKKKVYMNKETAQKTVKWLKEKILMSGTKRVHINFYGGEPLLNVPIITLISSEMKDWAKKEGLINYQASATTNGSLLTPGILDKLLEAGVSRFQVTLDGDKKEHNKKRPFLDGSGSFEMIIDNLDKAVDKADIEIVGNFDKENAPTIPWLVDFLEKKGYANKIKNLDFTPIIRSASSKKVYTSEKGASCAPLYNEEMFQYVFDLKKIITEKGFKTGKRGLVVNICGFFKDNDNFVIDPEGVIYNCPAVVGYKELSVGHLDEKHLNYNHTDFMTLEAWNNEKCINCVFVPFCQGGCRFAAYVEKGDIKGLFCRKSYLDKIAPELLKREYQSKAK
jgi:uncharacterized protein